MADENFAARERTLSLIFTANSYFVDCPVPPCAIEQLHSAVASMTPTFDNYIGSVVDNIFPLTYTTDTLENFLRFLEPSFWNDTGHADCESPKRILNAVYKQLTYGAYKKSAIFLLANVPASDFDDASLEETIVRTAIAQQVQVP